MVLLSWRRWRLILARVVSCFDYKIANNRDSLWRTICLTIVPMRAFISLHLKAPWFWCFDDMWRRPQFNRDDIWSQHFLCKAKNLTASHQPIKAINCQYTKGVSKYSGLSFRRSSCCFALPVSTYYWSEVTRSKPWPIWMEINLKFLNVICTHPYLPTHANSVTRFGDLLDFGQVFKPFGNN